MEWNMNPTTQNLLGLAGSIAAANQPTPYKVPFGTRAGLAAGNFNNFYNQQLNQRAALSLAEKRAEMADKQIKEAERVAKLQDKMSSLMERVGKLSESGQPIDRGLATGIWGTGMQLGSAPAMQAAQGLAAGPYEVQKIPQYGGLVTRQGLFGQELAGMMPYDNPRAPGFFDQMGAGGFDTGVPGAPPQEAAPAGPSGPGLGERFSRWMTEKAANTMSGEGSFFDRIFGNSGETAAPPVATNRNQMERTGTLPERNARQIAQSEFENEVQSMSNADLHKWLLKNSQYLSFAQAESIRRKLGIPAPGRPVR